MVLDRCIGRFRRCCSGMAYLAIPHVTERIDRFLTGSGDNFQVDRGLEAISSGGWFGRGPGEGPG